MPHGPLPISGRTSWSVDRVAGILVATITAAIGVALGTASPQAQSPRATVWDGVYTTAQAARGEKVFVASCGGCHRDDASGGDDGEPPLRGPNFASKWDEAPVAAVYDFIATNMPRSRPGSLKLQDCADVVAFLLKLNEVPPGATELTTDIDKLAGIRFTEKRPAR